MRPSTVILLVLVLCLGGGATLLFLMSESEPTFDLPTLEELTEEPTDPDAGLDPDDAGATGQREEVEGSTRERAKGPILEVVDAESQAPIAGALVRFIEERSAERRHRQSGDSRSVDTFGLADRYGSSGRTNSEGILQLPPVRRRLLVVASEGGRYGATRVESKKTETVRVELVADESVTFAVVDGVGASVAGAPLAVQCSRQGRSDKIIWGGDTGPDGLVTISHFQLYRKETKTTLRYSVGFALPLLRPVGVVFQDVPLPSEPVVLTMPETGRVAVTMRHVGNSPVRSEGRLRLKLQREKGDDGPPPGTTPFSLRVDELKLTKPAGDHPLVFAQIGLGVALKISADFEKMRFPSILTRGPASDGETVRVVLRGSKNRALLLGRALGPNGKPLAGSELEIELLVVGENQIENVQSNRDLETDPSGRLEMMFSMPRPQATHVRVRLRRDDGDLGVTVEAPALVANETAQLGDLKLTRLPTLAKGRVIDSRGEPVDGASLRVEREQLRPGKESRWSRDKSLSVIEGEDGQIEIQGEAGVGALRVRAKCRGFLDGDHVTVVPGRPFEIRLVREAGIRGSLLLEPWVGNSVLRVTVQAVGAERSLQSATLSRVGKTAKRRFDFDDLPAGTYSVIVRVRGEQVPLANVSGVVLGAGDTGRDERLRELDLRGRLRRISVRVVDEASKALSRATIVALDEKKGSRKDRGRRTSTRRGKLDLVTTAHELRLFVFAKGYRPQVVRAGAGETRVTLVELPSVVLQVENLLRRKDEGLRWYVNLRARRLTAEGQAIADLAVQHADIFARKKLRPMRSTARIGRDGTARVDVAAPGTYRIEFFVYKKGRKQPHHVITTMTVGVPLKGLVNKRVVVEPRVLNRVRKRFGLKTAR